MTILRATSGARFCSTNTFTCAISPAKYGVEEKSATATAKAGTSASSVV